MKVILDCENANISYDRTSNSIIALLNEDGDLSLEKIFQKIEYAFSRYNAKYLISNCSLVCSQSKDPMSKFLRHLIKNGIEKIAFVGDENSSNYNLSELESFSLCQARSFPCVNTAQEWITGRN